MPGYAFEGFASFLQEVIVPAITPAIRLVMREELRSFTPVETPALKLVTLREAENLTSFSSQTISKWIKRGDLKPYGKGKSRRVDIAELLSLLSKQSGATSPSEAELGDDAFAAKLLAGEATRP